MLEQLETIQHIGLGQAQVGIGIEDTMTEQQHNMGCKSLLDVVRNFKVSSDLGGRSPDSYLSYIRSRCSNDGIISPEDYEDLKFDLCHLPSKSSPSRPRVQALDFVSLFDFIFFFSAARKGLGSQDFTSDSVMVWAVCQESSKRLRSSWLMVGLVMMRPQVSCSWVQVQQMRGP